jgi:uncharacterized protein with HEPN domain
MQRSVGQCSNCMGSNHDRSSPGETIDPDLLAREPETPWQDVAGMRNHLAHRYFDTAHALVHASLNRLLDEQSRPSRNCVTPAA